MLAEFKDVSSLKASRLANNGSGIEYLPLQTWVILRTVSQQNRATTKEADHGKVYHVCLS